MGIGMNRLITGVREGSDKLGRPTQILTLDDRGELVLEYGWWERLGSPNIGDLLIIAVSTKQRTEVSE